MRRLPPALLPALLTLYGVTTLARLAAAGVWFARERRRPPAGDTAAGAPVVTVLQPILSGDPALEACLLTNLANHPRARFLWLVDEDDAPARALAARALAGAANLEVRVAPPPRDGENPKVAKLARAWGEVATPLYAVLDDDTVLPPGGLARAAAALSRGDLATGLPVYVERSTPWSRLLAAFVNGSVAITYPPAALLGASRTLNGMFYLGRTETLRRLGGFEAIRGALTDDYAMARLHLDAGLAIVQTDVALAISTTVPDAGRYAAIGRRWMIFAGRYVRENAGPFTLGLVAPGALLPPLLMAAGAARGPAGLLLATGALFAKAALTTGVARWGPGETRPGAGDLAWQVAADLLTPFHLLAALARPGRFDWRSRRIRMDGERIVYE